MGGEWGGGEVAGISCPRGHLQLPIYKIMFNVFNLFKAIFKSAFAQLGVILTGIRVWIEKV